MHYYDISFEKYVKVDYSYDSKCWLLLLATKITFSEALILQAYYWQNSEFIMLAS